MIFSFKRLERTTVSAEVVSMLQERKIFLLIVCTIEIIESAQISIVSCFLVVFPDIFLFSSKCTGKSKKLVH